MPVSKVKNLADTEPVVGLIINGKVRAYPLRILTWHEIVNDGLSSVPDNRDLFPALQFGHRLRPPPRWQGPKLRHPVKLRHSEMVMYDCQTENWWQQFLG